MWSKKVKYQLTLKDKTVTLQFTQMDESIRYNNDGEYPAYKASNGIILFSAGEPELFYDRLFIFGTNENADYNTVTSSFRTTEDARVAYEKYRAALREAFPQNPWKWAYGLAQKDGGICG